MFSCGGGIARLSGAGVPVTVVTPVTADQALGLPLSPRARRIHTSWAAGDQPFAARREEDFRALRLLGAAAEHLGLLDAIYRRSPSGDAFYDNPLGTPVAEDVERFLPQLVAALRESALGAHPDARVFCPAGTGGHIDHVLTRRAVEQIVDANAIVFYDEYPYVTRRGVTPACVHAAAQILELTAEEVEARIAAASCYDSQLRGLFPSRGERLKEIASARIPLVGRWLTGPPDVPASRGRMAERIRRDLATLGGEPYHWPGAAGSPFPVA